MYYQNCTLCSPSKLEVTRLSLIFFLYCMRLALLGNSKPSVEALSPRFEALVGVSSSAPLSTVTIESQQQVRTRLASFIPASVSTLGSELIV